MQGDAGADRRRAYFQANLRLIGGLLAIWAAVSFGCGILLAPSLNAYRLPFTEYPLGFWFAQHGSIYVFVLLIVIYVVAMNRIDRRFGVAEREG
jgi:putative solute:sodium symporter small subunit